MTTANGHGSDRYGVPPRGLCLALAAGAILGVAYSLAPLAVIWAVATGVFLRLAGRGIPQPERRWLLAILVIAIAMRVTAIGLLLVTTGTDSQSLGILFGDEGYLMRRTLRVRNIWLGYTGLAYDYVNAFEEYANTGYLYLVAYLQVLLGPSPYSLRLVNAGMFVGAVYILYRIARAAYGPVPALFGLSMLLFLPTQFVWSISLLKESGYLLMTALALLGVIRAARAQRLSERFLWSLAAIAGVILTYPFRTQGIAILVVAIMLAFAIWWAAQRARRAFALACLAPFLMWGLLQEPHLRGRYLEAASLAAHGHIGHVFTIGHAYKTLDDHFYRRPSLVALNLNPEEAGRFVVRSIAAFVFVPAPWQVESTPERLYLPEHMVWLVLLGLALIGVWPAFRHDVVVTSVLVSYALVASAAVALTSGNVGTLIRHRSLSIPFLVWFTGVAIAWLLDSERKRVSSSSIALTDAGTVTRAG